MQYLKCGLAAFLLATVACGPTASGGNGATGTGDGQGTTADGTHTTGTSSAEGPFATGSDTTPGDTAPKQICDGSEGLRLGYRGMGGGDEESEIFRDIGYVFLYVTGGCDFFVWNRERNLYGQGPRVHTGTLDTQTEQALSEALAYSTWDSLEPDPDPGHDDGGTVEWSNGEHSFYCADGLCEDLGDLPAQSEEWLDLLWAEGAPWEGPARVEVHADGPDDGTDPDVIPWPLVWPLEPVAYHQGDGWPPETTLVENTDDADTLRQIWQENLDPVVGSDLRFSDQGFRYRVYARDSVPLEDDDGRIGF